ncbi:hypothetical protein H6F76_14915 [Leptolyngbya sp. FACHB-321]|uniref:hypothetical protein n=1 Tax=Leptolyngbya sp. FACHB-321 TaxID=2692807 RepID=UPI00168668FB|nr:hypothetical protein [Leptolyngbya sp. FACHB-321]MBD2036306.1 hypothetical protein [Leptolyngbya sp. FACHB-321]
MKLPLSKGFYSSLILHPFAVDILSVTEDALISARRFLSWLVQMQQVQRLDDSNLLIAQLDLQLTPMLRMTGLISA